MEFFSVWTCPCCGELFDGEIEQPAGFAQPCNIPLCSVCFYGDLFLMSEAS